MELGLKGRTAVITGASMGIGKAVARSLGAEGAHVVLLARGAEALAATADELGGEGISVGTVSADISDPASVDAAATTVKEQRGTVHILVNNASNRMRRMDRQITWDDEDWLGDINVKLVGMLRVVRAFLPDLATDGTGRIINISGGAGKIVWHGAVTHGINNASMQIVTKYLAKDMTAEHINVNTVSPGLTATEWRHGWAETMAQNQGATKEDFLEAYTAQIGAFIGRWAEPAEIADVVTFLASDRASYITGSVIDVDGGITANAR